MKTFLIVLVIIFLFPILVLAADVNLRWDVVTGATGYKIYISTDNGTTWAAPKDAGNVTTYTYTGVPDTGLVLFKVGAYKTGSETISNWMGAWWNTKWMPLGNPVALGVK